MTSPVVIIGGGPVGLFTAITARLAGLEVIVLDRRTPPIDKACGEGIMPGGVALLRAAGVTLPTEGAAPFDGVRYLDEASVAEGIFPGGEQGFGVRRLHLHQALVDRAHTLGVDLRWGVTATGLAEGQVLTSEGPVPASVILGAAGLGGSVAEWAGLGSHRVGPTRLGLRRHFNLKPWTHKVEVYWADDAEAYVTPAGPHRVGVAFLWGGGSQQIPDLLARFPALAARLADAPFDSRPRGAGPLARRPRKVLGAIGQTPVALVGDAAGYLDALTGEGLTLGFRQAIALVERIQTGQLQRWPVDHRRLVRAPFALIRLLLWVRRRPWLRRRVLRALAASPDLFGRMLAINDGAPLRTLGVSGVLRLARGLVWPGVSPPRRPWPAPPPSPHPHATTEPPRR